MNDSPSESTSDDTQATTKAGLSRRVVVQGAAWSIPVIALAVATPLAAASGDAALSFTLPTYAGTACTEITNVQAALTNSSGAPDPGKPITVTLSDGYTFADGSTTYTGTTDASGKVTLPSVRVPATGGAASFVAAAGAINASAPVTAPKVTVAFRHSQSTNQVISFPTVPPGSTAIGDTLFLSPDGDLRWGDLLLASGVTSAGVPARLSLDDMVVPFISSSGVASRWRSATGQVQTFLNVPAGSIAIGDTTFQAPNGDLWMGNTRFATGALSVGVPFRSTANDSYTSFISSSGIASRWQAGTNQTITFPNVPAGSVVIGDNAFQAPNGDLWFGNTLVATGAIAAGVPARTSDNAVYVSYISSSGIASRWEASTNQTITFPNVPSDAIPVGDNSFLTPGGDLWVGNNLVATEVSSAGVPSRVSSNNSFTPYVVAPTCAW